MELTEVRINLCGNSSRLRAFCSLTFDNTFVVREVKLIEGNDGIFLAMPSRKLSDHCPRCAEKNHLRARFCNNCGARLNENRHQQFRDHSRLKLYADIAHPIHAHARQEIEHQVLMAYQEEVQRSKQPGYVAPNLDLDYPESPAAAVDHDNVRAAHFALP
ncbi:MAG TPA: SpoVG family protein [Tepidisphaeraceae bacterium]|jgi:stage V sporulation protein G